MFTFDIDMKKITEWIKKLLKGSSGFTLIELLVVIGILGVLAAALVATIDPFEQIKKANDSKVQNVTVEFQTSLVRYYTSTNGFPWESDPCKTDSAASAGSDGSQDITVPKKLSVITTCLDSLISSGELKAGFKTVVGVLDKIYVKETSNTPEVCYLPLSKAGQKDIAANQAADSDTTPTTWTRQVAAGGGSGVCISLGGTKVCWWCTQ
jgi:prepilin-type N-terminal cleavage/methylation domain-containing protein